MDNYSLKEVKMLIEKNLVSPEVFKNILNSTTRRLELYNDDDDLKILQYLSSCEVVPSDTKEEINKYLALYDSYKIKSDDNVNISKDERKSGVIIVFSVIVFLIVLFLLLILNRR